MGLGEAGLHLHLPAIRRVSDLDLVGCCDQSAERRTWWRSTSRVPVFQDMDQLLDDVQPELVVVATPPDTHTELCVAALEHGAHVICEKPLTTTVDGADRIIMAAERAGRGVAVNHHLRFQPIFAVVKEAIASRDHGELTFLQVWQLLDLPPWREPASWRAAMADRCLLESGVHFVDLMLDICGGPPHALSFHRSSGLDGPPQADALQILTLEFPGGTMAQLTVNRLSVAATRYAELRADCERTSLRASVGGRALLRIGKERARRSGVRIELAWTGLAWAEQGLRRTVLARNPRHAAIIATGRLLERAAAAFATGERPPASAVEARAALAVIEAAYACSLDRFG
jgi:predicted dehydrogenase